MLDWELLDVNNKLSYTDIILSDLGFPKIIIETKRPGSLQWNLKAIDVALSKALHYADEQKINRIAVSDGKILYARDLIPRDTKI